MSYQKKIIENNNINAAIKKFIRSRGFSEIGKTAEEFTVFVKEKTDSENNDNDNIY